MTRPTNHIKLFEDADSGLHLAEALKSPEELEALSGSQAPALPAGDKFAIYLRLSSLEEKNRQNYHIEIAKYALINACADVRGNLYVFENTDMVLVCVDANAAALENATQRLRQLFVGLTLLLASNKKDSICNWYDLATQRDQFEDICLPLTEGAKTTTPRKASATTRAEIIEPIDAEKLTWLERGLATSDVSSFIRRQPICKILPGLDTRPKYVASEIYVRVNDLRDTILPGVDLLANRWLFRHLTARLDQRVLATILENI